MTLAPEELSLRKESFLRRKRAFAALGHDGAHAATLVLDAAGPLDGPVLDLGTGMGGMARELARRGLFVESVDVSADDQEVAASLTKGTGLESRVRFTPAFRTAPSRPPFRSTSSTTSRTAHPSSVRSSASSGPAAPSSSRTSRARASTSRRASSRPRAPRTPRGRSR